LGYISTRDRALILPGFKIIRFGSGAFEVEDRDSRPHFKVSAAYHDYGKNIPEILRIR